MITFEPFGGAVTVRLFGKPWDWNIGGENKEDARMRIDTVTKDMNLLNIYAPKPSDFNAVICDPSVLREKIAMDQSAARIWRGCNADGTFLQKKGDAFYIGSADCPTIITRNPESGLVVAAHAGRDSLIDKAQVMEKKPYRTDQSVVDAIVACYHPSTLKNLRVFITCGISSTHFTHPHDDVKWGEHNKKMCAYIRMRWSKDCLPGEKEGEGKLGRIALSEIICSQFGIYDVSRENIGSDGIDTYSDIGEKGDYCFWSNRRGDGAKRNGVLIVRNW